MRRASLIGTAGTVALVCLMPAIAIAWLTLLILVQALVGLLHAHASGAGPRMGPQSRRIRRDETAPIFSVHVPTHNEPPSVVLKTLAALAAQRHAPAHEILVIDNNTNDPALWRPVEIWCARQPDFRFIHQEGVKGAKAGALNIALDHSDPGATHIVTVDADYVVSPDFLAEAARALAIWKTDFLQFPQAYLGAAAASGTSLELSDYFRRHARTANGAEAMLLTGTLSVISKPALIAVGGWRADTVTEDAELGLRLCRLGYRGRYVEREVGQGLLPFDILSLHKQRYRWTAGNVRTLMTGLRGLSLPRALHVVSQLTAWANMSLIFAAALVGAAVPAMAGTAADIGGLAATGMTVCYVAMLGPLALAAYRDGLDVRTLTAAMATRVALIPAAGLATVDSVFGERPSFAVTSKMLESAGNGLPFAILGWALTGLLLLILSPSAAITFGALLMLLPLPAGIFTDRRLRLYRSSLAAIEV